MNDYWRNWTCGRCGAPSTVGDDAGGWAMCARCEADYQASLDAQYPHGFCHECGAPYFLHTRRDGTQEDRAWHVEGGCSQWRDWADEDAAEDEALAEREHEQQTGFDPIAYEDAEQAYFTQNLEQAGPNECPVCRGELVSLGTLGRVEHFRCRACGLELSHPPTTPQAEPEPGLPHVYRFETPDEVAQHNADERRHCLCGFLSAGHASLGTCTVYLCGEHLPRPGERLSQAVARAWQGAPIDRPAQDACEQAWRHARRQEDAADRDPF
jgi:transcription elongation factor Elf1